MNWVPRGRTRYKMEDSRNLNNPRPRQLDPRMADVSQQQFHANTRNDPIHTPRRTDRPLDNVPTVAPGPDPLLTPRPQPASVTGSPEEPSLSASLAAMTTWHAGRSRFFRQGLPLWDMPSVDPEAANRSLLLCGYRPELWDIRPPYMFYSEGQTEDEQPSQSNQETFQTPTPKTKHLLLERESPNNEKLHDDILIRSNGPADQRIQGQSNDPRATFTEDQNEIHHSESNSHVDRDLQNASANATQPDNIQQECQSNETQDNINNETAPQTEQYLPPDEMAHFYEKLNQPHLNAMNHNINQHRPRGISQTQRNRHYPSQNGMPPFNMHQTGHIRRTNHSFSQQSQNNGMHDEHGSQDYMQYIATNAERPLNETVLQNGHQGNGTHHNISLQNNFAPQNVSAPQRQLWEPTNISNTIPTPYRRESTNRDNQESWPDVYEIYGTAIGIVLRCMDRDIGNTPHPLQREHWFRQQGLPSCRQILEYYDNIPQFQKTCTAKRRQMKNIIKVGVDSMIWPGDTKFSEMRDTCENIRKKALQLLSDPLFD